MSLKWLKTSNGTWNCFIDPLVVAWALTALTKVVLRIAPPVPEEITYLVRSTVLGTASYDASYPTSMVMDVQQVGSPSFDVPLGQLDLLTFLLLTSCDLFVESTRVSACGRDGVLRT